MKTYILIVLSIMFNIATAQDTTKVKSERILKSPTQLNSVSRVITMGRYTASAITPPGNLKSYGWINWGDGTGREEIYTEKEYLQKWNRYIDK